MAAVTALFLPFTPACPSATAGETIKVVMDDNYPPYIMRSDDGTLKGILVDLWQLWEQKTGIRAEIHAMAWAEAQQRLLKGEFDVIDTMFRTPKRSVLYDFSQPYAKIDVPLFFSTDIGGINRAEDARGFVVGVKAGDAAIELLQAQGVDNFTEFKSYEAIIAAARDDKIKVFTVDRPPALYFLNRMGIVDRFRETAPLYGGEFHRAVRKGNGRILDQVEKGFAKISAGEFHALERRWLGTPIVPSSWTRYGLLLLAIGTGSVVTLLAWVWLLRRGIRERTTELQRSNEYLQAVFNSVNDAIFIHDGITGGLIDVNRAMVEMYKITHDQALLATVDDLSLGTSPYSTDEAMAWLNKTREQGPQTFEWLARRFRGETFPVEVSIRYCHIGANPRFLVTVRDISTRKRTEQALVASENKYRQLYESMADAFVRVDMTGRISESNSAYQILVGYSPEELGTMTYIDLTPEQWREMESAIVETQILVRGYSEVYEKEYRRKDGVIIPVELRTFLIRDSLGNPESMWAIVRDLSERKQGEAKRLEMERQLLHAQKLESLGIMAGGIAHDFNNLLMAIQGNIDLALVEIAPESAARASLINCTQAIQRACDLTRQMLAYSGKGHFLIREIDLNTVVRENFHLFRASVAKTVELRLNLAAGLPQILADAGQLQQVIMNLLSNASEALDQYAGFVTITTGSDFYDTEYLNRGRQQITPAPGRFVWLEVTDTGCGMNDETLQRLFDPFFTTKFTGRGLGTSAILGIINGHQGAIVIDSVPGQGTSFKVLFPAAAESTTVSPREEFPPAGSLPAPEDLSAGQNGAILLVDDEDIVRKVCVAMLQHLGWQEVLEAANGMEAVELFRRHSATIRCAIIDLSMPRMDGMSTFRALRAISADTPVIIASGFSEENHIQHFTDQGVSGFIAKPFSMDKLRTVIELTLREAKNESMPFAAGDAPVDMG